MPATDRSDADRVLATCAMASTPPRCGRRGSATCTELKRTSADRSLVDCSRGSAEGGLASGRPTIMQASDRGVCVSGCVRRCVVLKEEADHLDG